MGNGIRRDLIWNSTEFWEWNLKKINAFCESFPHFHFEYKKYNNEGVVPIKI